MNHILNAIDFIDQISIDFQGNLDTLPTHIMHFRHLK